MTSALQIIKSDGKKELFNEQKLILSLVLAGASRSVAESVLKEVRAVITPGMSTHDIYRVARSILHDSQRHIVARYSLRRAVAALGPTGFPFEKFVSEIFRARGFEVMTDQMITGGCTTHEVDIVAYNDTELIMTEVKFHNEVGIKSDLKVALYVKARIDDLKAVTHSIAGKDRVCTDGWLVTNTKFTQNAIAYALCEHLTLIGWNYPTKNSLEDLIVGHKLFPITCLASLQKTHTDALLKDGIVLISHLKKELQLLDGLVDSTTKQHVIDELQTNFS